MDYAPPQPIELTDAETDLYAKIPASPSHQGWREVADAMEALADSLLERKAVPDVRLRLFSDPEYAEKGTRSREQVFESNGVSGREILRAPHFIEYLRHFIDGPNLPKPAIDGLCQILNDDAGTSGMVMKQYQKHARSSVREFGLSPSDAGTEFFRLGVEIGMDLHAARTLRDAARSTR